MFTLLNAFMTGYTSKPEINIQPVQKGDISTLAKIHAASFRQGWSDGEIEKMCSNDKYFCLVAHPPKTIKSKPVGFILVRSILEEAEVITIATDPLIRRKGVGQKLMLEAIRKLQFDRKDKLFLEVDEANTPAIKLYKNLGFEKIAEREGYYADSVQSGATKSTALVMQLELG